MIKQLFILVNFFANVDASLFAFVYLIKYEGVKNTLIYLGSVLGFFFIALLCITRIIKKRKVTENKVPYLQMI